MSDIPPAGALLSVQQAKPEFSSFAPPIRAQSPLRRQITAAYRRPETECLPPLVAVATLPEDLRASIASTARHLIVALRSKPRGSSLEELMQEYALSSEEGIALMCLAEALLRIPDTATRNALIRDKIAGRDWGSHIARDRSLFVNAATWGLAITGKLTPAVNDRGLTTALGRLIARCSEPVIRRGVEMAMRMIGEQFVTGETIEKALRRSRALEKKGFLYSYDMLGEAATTAADAERYYRDYESAIHAIGKASAGRGVYAGPGISIKLSALHPRYSRAQAARVMSELLPKVKSLAALAKAYDIGLNIDAEEADRLELSLDLLEELAFDPDLGGWKGLGFVVQAYGKRCPFVLDFIIDLARRSQRRIMVRLVKGAYWDAEIKRAQLDGLSGFPVYTRKVYTDVSYIACARKLLAATDAVFPQFATHNAQTLATVYHMAGREFHVGMYEFQCLHGMGEPLYDEVVPPDRLNRPCRIYAPVGTHETLLAYLVRRLLENGANSSFVNRIADLKVSVDELVTDPADVVRAMPVAGAPHEQIALPSDLIGPARTNSAGLDLSNEDTLASLSTALAGSAKIAWSSAPCLADGPVAGTAHPVLNPGNHADVVGSVIEASPADARRAARLAAESTTSWASRAVSDRGACLDRAADLMQEQMPTLLGLIAREAGKSLPNAIAEVREAIDFLRYYAQQARRTLGPEQKPLGPVVCISPWNFPLAIFTGQIAAALVAGNPVLAKPAEETPLIAAAAVRILYESGVPPSALQFLPGDGRVGAALVAAPEIAGVMFTGSTEVARLIQRQLSERLSPSGQPIPLIAETGGQNAMIVDSSALAEQVVGDVIASAFDSAGQRCSALRVLCLQEDMADRILTMLKGALDELSIGSTDRLDVDVGPVISADARQMIENHIARTRKLGRTVEQFGQVSAALDQGTFVRPTVIELERISDLQREIFGPVLHVVRYRLDEIDELIDAINGTGFGLTFGLHTRLDETIAHVTNRVKAGNLYVNRNMIGAVVGVQPFGGRGLSGTGPKAGGPLYLWRLVSTPPTVPSCRSSLADAGLVDFVEWLEGKGEHAIAQLVRDDAGLSALGLQAALPGPVGEKNLYARRPRGSVLLLPETEAGLYRQLGAVLATGNHGVIDAAPGLRNALDGLPRTVSARLTCERDWMRPPFTCALIEGDPDRIRTANSAIAASPGPLVLVQAASSDDLATKRQIFCLDWLLEEVSTSINTVAAGGNATLMTMV